LFKAGLFLVVGVIDHQAHTRDIRALGRYGPGWHGPRIVAVVSGASMAGIPLLFGFVAKESAYEAWSESHLFGNGFVLAGLVIGSMLTFAYTARLLFGMFVPGAPRERSPLDGPPPIDPPPAPRFGFWAPAAVLGAATTLLGLAPGLASKLVGTAASSLDPRVDTVHLALWHGFSTALTLSGVTIVGGAILVAAAPVVANLSARAPRLVDGDAAYMHTMRGVNLIADRLTGVLQSGSLPTYIAIILTTLVVVPGYALLHAPLPDLPAVSSGPGDLVAAALMVIGGTYAAIVRERMAAVLCLGAVGYGMALMFVLQGAPDLALTQVCVDTIGAVIFVLVLRQLPNWFSERPTIAGRTVRLFVSALVGVFVFAFILIAGDVRVDPPVSQSFLERALPEGGGRNVVNVVLVDIRGFDTMGEITVLAVAAMGAYSIARLSRRDRYDLGSRLKRRRWWMRRRRVDEIDPVRLEQQAMETT
jgi:multicomponent Na+:H+ antiporter subunit A